ncbi:LuxR family transcriptional regulator [Phaeobacter gallaeciensis]|jgi:PAS domain S-box-containing protein|uniref:LuxR C-terminal-related transcriptional regulator n=1 Tax=Phaeobacter gallaeciensis TaxID=60890 RepID=A0A1B0ZNQ1_9RHOB|nr:MULTISPECIES: LuxR C-terminal-related transcriptional regulator [Phaeobacter]MDF1770893.1 LuxR C-terminal-related transcriptional regulator [Pseudophaeobacter sp. bin_em_oilr2.035]MEE2633940.1 LuxR C-terminal-related transcriptional regulator [Pseudomonadota bacterium]ANP35775.1 LuxR family transcriptional regulator [Phaeobacter gallaeciensis]MDE4061683.1 LuxR C-terminal-related transcriptional regulator [Phaeobacter gallaeciensis]MDE4099137.1 LuxR C-terminal-related transcriptional regulat
MDKHPDPATLDRLYADRDLAQLAFEYSPVGIVVTENRVLRECNQRFCDMFGYAREELLDQLFSFLYPSDEEFQNLRNRGDKSLGQGNPYWDERVMKRKTGDLFWVRVRGHTFTPDEPLGRAVWSFADLSGVRPYQPLTRREREVYSLLREGKTSKEIARILTLSYRTVEVHRARLLKKVGANNTASLFSSLGDIGGDHVVGGNSP